MGSFRTLLKYFSAKDSSAHIEKMARTPMHSISQIENKKPRSAVIIIIIIIIIITIPCLARKVLQWG